MIQAVKHFHPYLCGRKFRIRTDHASLQWILSFRNPEGQVARWIEVLQTYNFTIEHRPGRKHGNADALSRRPCLPSCKYCIEVETKEANKGSQEPQVKSGKQPLQWATQKVECMPSTRRKRWYKRGTRNSILGERTKPRDKDELEELQWTTEQLKTAQQGDPDIGPIIQLMKEQPEQPPWANVAPLSSTIKAYWAQWRTLKLQDGILYRVWLSPTKDHVLQVVLPREYQEELIRLLHDAPTSGHFATDKTLCRVRQRFYWVGCARDVKCYCSQCSLCASRKGPAHRPRALLQSYNVGAPMEE